MSSINEIKVHSAQNVRLPNVEKMTLQNVPVYVIRGNSEPVLHLEFIFQAGRVHAVHPSVASATAAMLSEGTQSRTSSAIAEEVEFVGSTIRCNAGTDALSISVYSLSKHFEKTLLILEDILTSAVFPEVELSLYKQNREQKLEIALQQNEYLATAAVMRSIYGPHVYGYSGTSADILNLSRDSLLDHSELLGTRNLNAFICGDVDESHLKSLDSLLSRLSTSKESIACAKPELLPAAIQVTEGPQHMQCAIRLGQQAIIRTHENYPGLFFLNTLLGGYFGSRLMKNIREEKGLTYGISSSLESLVQGSVFIISTEASLENKDVVLQEIKNELGGLRNAAVSERECIMVRNYIMGNMMMQLDGPFRSMDVIKTFVLEQVPFGYFDNFIDSIKSVSPSELQSLANTYLDWDNLHQVVVQ
jgi:zinc protease